MRWRIGYRLRNALLVGGTVGMGLFGWQTVALSLGGHALGKVVATPVERAQTAVVDRFTAPVSMPPLPVAPHYPLSTPRLLPSCTGSPVGATFATDEATPLGEPGPPIAVLVPRGTKWRCLVFSLAGNGTASTAEWECSEGFPDTTGKETSLRVLLAPCPQPCDAQARARLRPPFMGEPTRAVDDSTWLAAVRTDPDGMGRRTLHLSMEHVWAAPVGLLGPGSPGQNLYVAAHLTNRPDDRATGEKIMNSLRSQM
ncbi:hypothetical protein GA0070607_5541 [Micromonospora coriariae]|uniref:Uncharacterized protein n=1 Tax=Micromonospora coriariae TaxID=285665 RepID=A0A1C4XNE1_9ACTN|nr:hypothetical protein [Micromonospora coriariae]SCF10040.1 hypothetical protein GA0070607_5541 [Micromonospora coriariae]